MRLLTLIDTGVFIVVSKYINCCSYFTTSGPIRVKVLLFLSIKISLVPSVSRYFKT